MQTLAVIALLVISATACGQDEPEREDAPDEIAALFDETSARLVAMSSPDGWVVSRKLTPDGQWADVEHTGDSLLWTGMAMGVLSCAKGGASERALLAMLSANRGRVWRHPSNTKRPSLDGHLGLYWGVIKRVARCPDSRDIWRKALQSHTPISVPEAFRVVLEETLYRVGSGPKPRGVRVDGLANLAASWASVVVASRAAGYRIHLGWLAIDATSGPKGTFCPATRGAGMHLIEHFCGRSSLAGWIERFTLNRQEYGLQRAKWESTDGRPGLATPALDLLVAIRQVYNLGD